MTKQPRVSVVIPTYNDAEYLSEAIESVLAQTYTDYEIIVIDDGSADNTRQVLDPYQDKIRYIYQKNQGVAAARNRGINLARGELIAFLDADDLFLPDKLQQQVTLFDVQPHLGMVISGWRIVNEQGKIISEVEFWQTLPELDLETWLFWKPVLPSATMIRHYWLEKVDGFSSDAIPAEDVECFINLVAIGCQADWCCKIGTLYRQINSQSLSQNTIRQIKSLELVHQRFFARGDLPVHIRKLENKIHFDNLVWSAWRLYQSGSKQEMLQYLRKSVNYTTNSSAEIIITWLKSFQDNCTQENYQQDIYSLTQIPGWQELMVHTLKTKKPRVSIIIPAYNSAKYLLEAIESVLNQTYADYEIIVIDDGSTDNTSKVIEPCLQHIRYFQQENQGVSAARNRGLDLARGELIAFLDADDIFMPYKLEEQVAVFDAQPEVGIVNSGFRIIKEDGEFVTDVERWREIPDLTPEIWLLHKPVLPSAMMFRREWFDKVGGFDCRFFSSEDVEITLRMVAKGCQATWLPKITVYYRRHDRSATWGNALRQAKNSEQMQDYFFAQPDLPESMRCLESQSRFDQLVWLAWLCYQGGFNEEMADYLRKSWEYTPYSWPETIAQWIISFRNCSKLYGYELDAYSLSNLSEWQKLTLDLKVLQFFHHYHQQVTDYQNLLAYQPKDSEKSLYAETYFQLGNQLTRQRNLDQGIIFFRKAIELVPKNAWYHNGLGNALKNRSDLEEAIAVYRKAIRLKSDEEQFQQNLDEALQLQKRWETLTNYCQQVIKDSNRVSQNTLKENPLKILMIFPYPPYPPQKGGAAIRMFEQIKYFGSRHHLTVVSLIFSESDYLIEEQLASYCDRAFMVKLGVPMTPNQENVQQQLCNLKTWNMWKTLQQLSQIDFDVVFFEFIVSATYYPLFSDRFTILNEHNIESKLLRRCAASDTINLIPDLIEEVPAATPFLNAESQSKLLEEYENQTWHKFPLRTVVSEDDKKELESRCSVGKTIIVNNGIDTKSIIPVNNNNTHKLLYMGTMTYYPNIDAVLYFVEQIFPQIQQQNQKISLCIAGREPPKIIKQLTTSNSEIEVIADPKDMSAVAQQCSIAIVPLRLGSGTRIKILHSMAMGLPVISTSLGCEGLEVTDEVHLLIRDNPKEFAQAVLKVNSDEYLRNNLRKNGRKLVEEKYDWQNIFAQYEQKILHEKQVGWI